MTRPYLKCSEVIDFIRAWRDGELTAAQETEFHRHLAVCPACVNYLASYQRTIELAKAAHAAPDAAAGATVPEELIRAILAARRPAR